MDNGSVEAGTADYMNILKSNGIRVIRHDQTRPLNWVWNDFYDSTQDEYLCFLNNDVRIPCNFVSDTKAVLDKEPDVGIACHVTNNPDYILLTELNYKVMFENIRQGWDFTIRRKCYNKIPESLKVYCGDDYLYAKLYEYKWKAAMILSSPIIHYLGMTVKSVKKEQYGLDTTEFTKMGIKEYKWSGFSKGRPEGVCSGMIKSKLPAKLTINIVTYERHEELKNIVEMLLNQTDPRFIADIWQDGPDEKKRKFIEGLRDDHIKYSENPSRQNRYGHDMRHASIMNCQTEYWCTSNDDNLISPLFVERILQNIENYDMLRYSVAMANLAKKFCGFTEQYVKSGKIDIATYNNDMTVLDTNLDVCGQVDACSFIVKTSIIKQIGWQFMEFHGDFLEYDKLIKMGLNIKRLQEVLQVHK